MPAMVRTGLLASVAGGLVFVVVLLAPLRITASVQLATCYWDEPVVVLDAREVPVARWPDGLSWDWQQGGVIDGSGTVRFRLGDRVNIEGQFVTVHGDPSPCFQTRNIRIDRIVAVDDVTP